MVHIRSSFRRLQLHHGRGVLARSRAAGEENPNAWHKPEGSVQPKAAQLLSVLLGWVSGTRSTILIAYCCANWDYRYLCVLKFAMKPLAKSFKDFVSWNCVVCNAILYAQYESKCHFPACSAIWCWWSNSDPRSTLVDLAGLTLWTLWKSLVSVVRVIRTPSCCKRWRAYPIDLLSKYGQWSILTLTVCSSCCFSCFTFRKLLISLVSQLSCDSLSTKKTMPERLLAFSFLQSSQADLTHSDGILTRCCNVGGTVWLSLNSAVLVHFRQFSFVARRRCSSLGPLAFSFWYRSLPAGAIAALWLGTRWPWFLKPKAKWPKVALPIRVVSHMGDILWLYDILIYFDQRLLLGKGFYNWLRSQQIILLHNLKIRQLSAMHQGDTTDKLLLVKMRHVERGLGNQRRTSPHTNDNTYSSSRKADGFHLSKETSRAFTIRRMITWPRIFDERLDVAKQVSKVCDLMVSTSLEPTFWARWAHVTDLLLYKCSCAVCRP